MRRTTILKEKTILVHMGVDIYFFELLNFVLGDKTYESSLSI